MDRRNGKGRRGNGGGGNPKTTARPPANTATEAWLNAIQDATECITPSSSFGNEDEIAASLGYLGILALTLEQCSHAWDDVPMGGPPEFRKDGVAVVEEPDVAFYTGAGFTQEPAFYGYHDPPPPAAITVSHSENRFATFQYDSDSDDDDDDDDDDEHHSNEYTPATALPPPPPSTNSSHSHLSMRRLMIRIVTAQSEVYACQASHAPPQWQQGAELYQLSLFKIHQALSLADSECARWLEQGDIPTTLKEDANVVEVAIQYLTQQTDKFRQRAHNKERQLMQRLEPQWQSRDAIKQKWGSERWTSNPRPKRNYAAAREADEEQLRQIRAALQSLEEMDTEGAVQSSQEFKDQVTSGKKKKKKSVAKRDNGQRPTDLSKRVPLSEYPDATDFGWTFTGSNDNVVEFFENDDGVKLDWYFTTATVKTSLDHPTQGKTQLFGARVTPNTYLEILLNPRAHTNERYHTRNEKKPSRDLWEPHD